MYLSDQCWDPTTKASYAQLPLLPHQLCLNVQFERGTAVRQARLLLFIQWDGASQGSIPNWVAFSINTRGVGSARSVYSPSPCKPRTQAHQHYIPSKHQTSNQCWFDVGPASWTLAQHQTSIGTTCFFSWDLEKHLLQYYTHSQPYCSTNTISL